MGLVVSTDGRKDLSWNKYFELEFCHGYACGTL